MASDSRVSGSEETRTPTPDKGADGVPGAADAAKQPDSRRASPTAGQGDAEAKPAVRKKTRRQGQAA